MVKISVVINTLNEEENLPRALRSIKGFADEIVVVDMHSDDKTVGVAEKAGAKVYQHKREGYLEPARNYAIEKATGKWILILDADEEASKSLIKILKKIVQENKYDYVAIPRKNIVFGKWLEHSRWWPDYNVRFFKKGKVVWDDKIHSIPETIGDGMDLKAKRENAIIHHHYNSLSQYIQRMDRYTSIQSDDLIKGGHKFKWKDLIGKPLGEFMSRYFKGFGYKDGVHGLSVSLLQAFSEAVVYMKVWETEGFKKEELTIEDIDKELKSGQKEMNYWISDTLLREKGGLLYRIRRKLRI